MRHPPRPSAALEQMLRENGELDQLLEGRGLEPTPVIEEGPEPEPPKPLVILPPPWSEHYNPELDPTPDFVEAESDEVRTSSKADAAVEGQSESPSLAPSFPTEREPESTPRGRRNRKALRRSIRQAWAR